MNPEEHKLGIKGSSTRQLFFNDCAVPVDNLLSQRENGFKIAGTILNIGRIKLGAATIGSGRSVLTTAVKYANAREQFNLPISKFGAIRYKLAEMAIQLFANESAAYRAGQHIDDAFDALLAEGMDQAKAKLKAVEQFAIECAIIKVWCSEMLDYVVDEGVQIYGGMGYSAEAPMERAYRDSRINRIFEGTNEVNRLLVVDMLLKRAMKGELDLMGPAQAVADELLAIPDFDDQGEGEFASEKKIISNLKKACLKFRELDKKVKIHYLNGDKTPAEVAAAKLTGVDYHVSLFKKNPTWVKEFKDHKLKTNAWTVNEEEDMKYLIEQKIDYITTDEPELLTTVLKQ